MQKRILQLTIFLNFILGNAYQSLIIASITDSHYGTKITTINEMLSNDYSYYVSRVFEAELNGSDYYQRMKGKFVKNLETLALNYKKLSSQRIAIVTTCSHLDSILDKTNMHESHDERSFEYYYKLDEKFSSFFLALPVKKISFFREALQKLSLEIFESGIKQATTELNQQKKTKAFIVTEDYNNANYMLNLRDISPAFYLLIIGLVLSSIAIIIETFWNDFMRHNLQRCFTKFLIRNGIQTQKTFKHQVVQVRPVNQEITEV